MPTQTGVVMPTYTYRCPKCEFEWIVIHKMDYAEKVVCNNCGHEAKKLIGTPPAHFKDGKESEE
jgi:putative FmdB family regulatory protein